MSRSVELPTCSQESAASCSHPLHHLHVASLLQQHPLASPEVRLRFQQRERLFRAGTLSAHSLLLLLHEAVAQGISLPHALLCHKATLTAAQKQQVMPPGVIVQKTLSLQFSDLPRTLVLVTGLGDFSLTAPHRHALADSLSITGSFARRSTINPAGCDPVALYGMQQGMITPFLAMRQPPIAAIGVMEQEALPDACTHVAISLSLFESLLLPIAAFLPLLERYVERMFPHVPLFPLHAHQKPFAFATERETDHPSLLPVACPVATPVKE